MYLFEHVTLGLLYIMSRFCTRIFYRGVPDLEMIVLSVFGAVDLPLASYMLVYFLEI